MLSIARLKSIRQNLTAYAIGEMCGDQGDRRQAIGTLFPPRSRSTPPCPGALEFIADAIAGWAISSTAGPSTNGEPNANRCIGQVSSKNHVGPVEATEGRTILLHAERGSATPSSSRATCQWGRPGRQDHPASSARLVRLLEKPARRIAGDFARSNPAAV